MGNHRTRVVALGLWALVVWAIVGAVLTRGVLSVSRAADVVAASALCPPACPAGATPTWVAIVVLSAWVLLAVGGAVALVLLVGRHLLDSRDS